MKKKLFMAALAALALVGCNDRNQSELKEETLGLKGKANISVQFFYNEGEKLVNGVKVNENLPVPSAVEVIAQVDYAEYTGADAGKSYKQFVGTKKGEGTYTFEIPAGEKKINVTIIANGFEADYYLTPENKITAYYPKKELTAFAVLAGQEFVKNDPSETTFDQPSNILNNNRTVKFAVSGKLTGKKEVWKDDALTTDNVGLAGQNVILTVKFADDTKDSRTLKFTAATNSEGAFEFKADDVMIYDEWYTALEEDANALEMKLSVKPWADEKFVHYYKYLFSSRAEKIWDKADTYKTKKDACATEKDWIDYLDGASYLDDGKLRYLYAIDADNKKSVEVTGSWNVKEIDVANIQAAVTLFGKALNQDLVAEFVPADVKSVLGVGTTGNEVTVQCKNEDKVKVPTTTIYDVMGWNK